ncbi:hypothetical protein [Arthrobacter sp. MMS24-S77]
MKRNPAVWLLLTLILGFYSIYIFSSMRGDSWWAIVSGVVLVVASLASLWKFLRDVRASRNHRSGE